MSARNPGVNTQMLTPNEGNIGGPCFILQQTTVVGTASYSLHHGAAPFKYKVIAAFGYMTAAGGGADTVQLQDKAGNAITDALSVAALGDTATFTFTQINDANNVIEAGSDDLVVVTADGVACHVCALCVKEE